MKKSKKRLTPPIFATVIGITLVTVIFGAAIGAALYVQNQETVGQQAWPLF